MTSQPYTAYTWAMHRRDFMASTLGATFMAASSNANRGRQPGGAKTPEYYMWRQYLLRTGTQPQRLGDFLQNAAVPALNRLGHSPIGVFEATFGVPSPTIFVLIPSSSVESLMSIEAGLERDQAFMKAADGYLNAPATDPVYVRQEVSLLTAFPNVPRIEVPAATAAKGPRLFELRTYESHNERAHRAKVRMFAEMGEVDIFRASGLTPVFFSRTFAGPRMPSLMYMLVHENMAGREKSWDNFRNNEEWKKLSSTPGYTDPEIVSNITTVFLRPASYSQI
jgi:hypothetical protein